MAYYLFKNEKTGEEIKKEFSMKEEIPKEIIEDNKIFIRSYISGTSVHIPYQWGHESNIKYGKSPSGRKHFF